MNIYTAILIGILIGDIFSYVIIKLLYGEAFNFNRFIKSIIISNLILIIIFSLCYSYTTT
jgi:ABC-type antimicrobial peptide transport system permease subunit